MAMRKTISLTAHRAGGRLGPENSLQALRRATALGVPWAEIDVQLSADGVVVVVHDENLARTASVEKMVRDCTLDELRQLTGDRRDPIPTLEECIAVVRGRAQLNIEMKEYGQSAALPARVVAVLREKDFVSGARVCSFSRELVRAAQALEPRLAVGYVMDEAGDLPGPGEAAFVSVNQALITPALVRAAHHRQLEVHAWTVNERPTMLRLLAMGVDNLITDDPVLGKEGITAFQRKNWLERQLLRW
jgi:glycerophosphoryl diester phosphodiesterase